MLTERKTAGKIEILINGVMQIREDTIIERDGVEIARTFHRKVLSPGDNISNEADQRIRDIAGLLWTPEVIQDYKTKFQAQIEAATRVVSDET